MLPLSLSTLDETSALRARQPKQTMPTLADLSQAQIAQDESWRNDLNRRHLTSLAQINAEESLRPDPKDVALKDTERNLALERSGPASLADLARTGLPEGTTQGESIQSELRGREPEKERQNRLALGKMATDADVAMGEMASRDRQMRALGAQFNRQMSRLEADRRKPDSEAYQLTPEEYAEVVKEVERIYRRQMDALDGGKTAELGNGRSTP